MDDVIDDVTLRDFTDAQRDGLTSFVRRGGGCVGLHCAADRTAGVGDFVVHDDPYQLDSGDDVSVLARMDHPENGDTPVDWAQPPGDGRQLRSTSR